ncbi:ATP12 family chaperone protein [Acuticoccus sp.]|uniref:ATP12 family chaperone protein n=1 Tax=Acuticoccus sp. TaxID=1904378 RepID=UPI003B51645D
MNGSAAGPPEALRRFYTIASTAPEPGGTARVLLDGRPVRTPARALLAVPPRIAEAIAAEWNAQGERILPLTMPLTRLANTAIDGVREASAAVRDDVAAIASNDLVLYRADAPAGLVAAQQALWDDVVAYGEGAFGVRLALAEGVMPVQQDERLAARVAAALPGDALALAAMHQLATLTGSALLALMVRDGSISFDDAWAAAHVDEDWNIREWGEDEEATRRRAQRERDAKAAAFILRPEMDHPMPASMAG